MTNTTSSADERFHISAQKIPVIEYWSGMFGGFHCPGIGLRQMKTEGMCRWNHMGNCILSGIGVK
jgi:hypothetical protein